MKSKKGFTLLEVLLVIDILVIISLIAIPIVMSNIDSARRRAFEQDVNSVFKSAEINLRTTIPNSPTCYSLDTVDVTHKDKFISGQVCKDSNHNYSVKKLCTKDLCYNGDLETGSVTDYAMVTLPVMKYLNHYSDEAWHNANYNSKIVSIAVLDNKTVPDNKVVEWDVSALGDGSVKGWLMTNSIDNTKYDLFIGGKGGVKANQNSSGLFYGFKALTSVDLTYLDTSQVTTMYAMFYNCENLQNINVSAFDTTMVTDIS